MNKNFSLEKKPVQSGLIIAVSGLVGSFLAIVIGLSLGVNTSSLFFVIASLVGVGAVVFGLVVLCVGFLGYPIFQLMLVLEKLKRNRGKVETEKELKLNSAIDNRIERRLEDQDYELDEKIRNKVDEIDLDDEIYNFMDGYDMSYKIASEMEDYNYLDESEVREIVDSKVDEVNESIGVILAQLDEKIRNKVDVIDYTVDSNYEKVIKEERFIEKQQNELELIRHAKELNNDSLRQTRASERKRDKYNKKMVNLNKNPLSIKATMDQYYEKDGYPRYEEDGRMIFGEEHLSVMIEDQTNHLKEMGEDKYNNLFNDLSIRELILVFSTYGTRNQNGKHLGRLSAQLESVGVYKVRDLIDLDYLKKVRFFEAVPYSQGLGIKSTTFLNLYERGGQLHSEKNWVKQKVKNILNPSIFGSEGDKMIFGVMAHFYLMEAFENVNLITKELGVKRNV